MQRYCGKVYIVLLVWCFPANMKVGHGHRDPWVVLYMVQWALGLATVLHKNGKKHYMRQMLRAFPPELQETILKRQFHSARWVSYVRRICKQVGDPTYHACGKASNYMAFSSESCTWYTGKANLLRQHGRGTIFGVIGSASIFIVFCTSLVRRLTDLGTVPGEKYPCILCT